MKKLVLALVLCLVPVAAQEHESKAAEHKAESHEGAAEHKEGGHEEPSILWKWANFALLAGILGWLVSKNAGPYFAQRNKDITGGLEEARKLRADSEARVADIERRVANLESEMAGLRSTSKAEMAAEGERMRQETARMIEKMQAHATGEIESASKQARMELKTYSAELALDLAQQQVRQRLTPETQEALAVDFVKQLASERKGSQN
ncbi:MAG: ATP synthase F0 subunit B [Bryobacterales bacterium]|nr:ATP synthase F0 subunit B [Bryobacterales bacterium]